MGAFSRDFTTILAPECRAFSGALKIEKLKALLIPGPKGAVDTNDWCINFETAAPMAEWIRSLNFSTLNYSIITAVSGVGSSPALATCEKPSSACVCVRWSYRGTPVSPHLPIGSSRYE